MKNGFSQKYSLEFSVNNFIFFETTYCNLMKVYTLSKNTRLILALAYGFMLSTVVIDYFILNDTGDINRYFTNASRQHNSFETGDYTTIKISIFYYFTYLLTLIQRYFFATEFVSSIFITTTLTGTLTALAILPKNLPLNSLLIKLPLLLMCLLMPRVLDLLVSNLRHGFACSIFLYSAIHLNGTKRLLGNLLCISMHMGMIPIVVAYWAFFLVKDRFYLYFYHLCLAFFLSVISVLVLLLIYNVGTVSFKWGYTTFSAIFALVMFMLAGKWCQTVLGGIFVFLILLVFMAIMIDRDITRYFGFAIILFSIFIAECKDLKRITLTMILFTPFFFIYHAFWLK